MNILSAENLYKTYGDKVLFDHISFGIDEGERIGLIGVNGTGKSTLLKVIAGVDTAESGRITVGGQMTVHYVPQEPVFNPSHRVLDAVFQGDIPIMQVLRQYEEVLAAVERHGGSVDEQARLVQLQSRLDDMGGWQLEYEAKAILTRLGVIDFEAQVGTLSGGQRKRIALARALIQPSDLLILDEPTNHIDDERVTWLENYLLKRKGALLLVTHDRYFLDHVVNRIFELHQGRLYRYTGNYNDFLEAKLVREADLQASEEKRQNFLRRELEWIKRGPKARGTKQKARTDRYYEVLEQTPEAVESPLELTSIASRLGKTVIELKHVSKSFGETRVINDFSYIMLPRDRIGIVGPNGSGKSTLLKLMNGVEIPDEGEIVTGSTVKVGYFSQEHDDLDPAKRAIDIIREVAEYVPTDDGHLISASQMMERFLFPGSLQWTPVGKLSGGEKRRLVLLRTLMSQPNVLLFDEPTNDLDIATLQVLEQFLDEFEGAVVVVSHDRWFLDRIAEKIFSVQGNGRIDVYTGNYSETMGQLVRDLSDGESAGAAGVSVGTAPAKDTDAPSQHTAGAARRTDRTVQKFTYKEQKEYDEIEDHIAATEQALQQVTREMEVAGSDYARLQKLHVGQQQLEAQLNELMDRWAYLSERAEEIAKSRQV